MKRNGRARNGTEAKRRRARIARRLAYSIPKARDRAVALEYLEAVFPGSRIVWRRYDRHARRFDVAVFHPPPHVWTEPISITIGFNEKVVGAGEHEVLLPIGGFEVEKSDWAPFRSYLEDATDRALRGTHIPAELLRPPPATPAKARAEEVIRLINEGKLRVEPPLPDPTGDDE